MTRSLVLGVVCCALAGCRDAGPPPASSAPPPPVHLARLGSTLLRHPGAVASLAFHPDGRTLASTGHGDPFVRVWEVGTGRELTRFATAAGNPSVLIGYTPDGERLVAVTKGGVTVFDTANDKEVAGFAVSDGYPNALALSPDGRTLAGRGLDKRLTVWDLSTGHPVRTLIPIRDAGWIGICFSPDGRELAVCDSLNWVSVVPIDGGPVRDIAVSDYDVVQRVYWPRPDRLVAIGSGVAVHDRETGKELVRKTRSRDSWPPTILAMSGGRLLARDATSRLIELDSDKLDPIPGLEVPIGKYNDPVAVSRDGRTVAVGLNSAVRLLDAKTGRPLHPDLDLSPTRPIDRASFSADGRRMLTHGYNTVRVWDVPAGRPVAVIDRDDGFIYQSALSPDGRWVAGADGASRWRLRVWDAATGAEEYREPDLPDGQPGATHVIGFDPAGGLWVFDPASGDIRRLAVPSCRTTRTIRGFPQTTRALLSADGRRLAVRGWTAFAVRDTNPTADWHVLERHPGRKPGGCGLDQPPTPVLATFAPDGGQLITLQGPKATVWDTTGRPAVVAVREGIGLYGLTFSPDGRRLAFRDGPANGSGGLRVWETATLAEAYRFDPPGGVSGFAFTPDGRRLVVGHPDTTLTVWDFEAVERFALGSSPTAPNPWERLASRDARAGLATVRQLAADPTATVTLLQRQFQPDRARIAQLIADLGDPRFPVRDAASRELAAAANAAEPALREAVEASGSAEVRERIRRILRRFESADGQPPTAHLRAVRAVEVLERIGTPEAKAILKEWVTTARLTERGKQAKSALDRLAGR